MGTRQFGVALPIGLVFKAPPHIYRAQAQIHPHAGRQVDHLRAASSTSPASAASTWLLIRSRSPFRNTSSSAGSRLGAAAGAVASR